MTNSIPTPQPQPTPGARRAARLIRNDVSLNGLTHQSVDEWATIIDRESAAPELLHVLEVLVEQGHYPHGSTLYAAKAAIAKAQGTPPEGAR